MLSIGKTCVVLASDRQAASLAAAAAVVVVVATTHIDFTAARTRRFNDDTSRGLDCTAGLATRGGRGDATRRNSDTCSMRSRDVIGK